MDRIPSSPPVIHPLPVGIVRPLWSVMIPAYNCSYYLQQTLESVLQQDPGENIMQIEVVDDCSTDDDVEALVQRIGNGRVLYYRQAQNVGSVRNFETCLNRANGHLIHLLHGDDKVRPGFYSKMASLFEQYPQVGAAFCSYAYIDGGNTLLYYHKEEGNEEGIFDNALLRMAKRSCTQYVDTVVKREIYEQKGGFFGVKYGEDWEMWARIAKDHSFAYTPAVLAEYRVHNENISSNSFRSGQNFHDIRKVIEQVITYVPIEQRQKIRTKARQHYARYALGNSEAIWHYLRDKKTVYKQVAGALKMHLDPFVLFKSLKIVTKLVVHPLRKLIGNVRD